MTAEQLRLLEDRLRQRAWRRWGPYLAERQWGTVREDYSPHGNAWTYFPHDMARYRAYRWGEDGIGGWSDDSLFLCLAVAMWNGKDPILKERLFGLSNGEGNHGEDVKELYYYLDGTPTHSYMRMLYKYPQNEFPYDRLVAENRARGKSKPEFELIDTGIFDENRYFDVFIEYAKVSPEDTLLRINVWNRGPTAASLHLLPQLWFTNTWSWGREAPERKPTLKRRGDSAIEAWQPDLHARFLYCDGRPEFLFCDNDTNQLKLSGLKCSGYFKDGIDDYVVHGIKESVNPQQTGTKVAAHWQLDIPAGESRQVRLRLTDALLMQPFARFDAEFRRRQDEADEFYKTLQSDLSDPDARLVQRQAWAGMLWNKQYYFFDVPQWLDGDPAQPPPPEERKQIRNREWRHLNNADVVSMPDKWEYPWYAAWDLAFHCLPLAQVDPEFAKQQLLLLTREWYMHPNGQLPAYEWNFGDVNPPVHAWATWRVFQIDRKQSGGCGDISFLERVFHKLMLNFTWWVNRKDVQDRNIFQGGFLGLDNIGVFDRSRPLPTGGYLNQADGTSWMAMYSLNLMRIALELSLHNPVYQDVASKFFEHFLFIASAMTNMAERNEGLWNDEDEFYYDELIPPSGDVMPLKLRSMVGLIPLFAVETLEPEMLERLPDFNRRLQWFLSYRPDLAQLVSRWNEPGRGERRLLSLLRGHRMKRLLKRMLDGAEFLSDYGIRSMSQIYRDNPYVFACNGTHITVSYQPAESDSFLFGGNSNWRGPIWFPVNYLIIESLQKFHHYYGDDFKVECPTGSGNLSTIEQVADELSRRLTRIFLKNEQGQRPVNGSDRRLQTDPNFRDYLSFFEYFDGDTGRGAGASHQTGWTGLVAKLLQPRRRENL